MTPTTNSICAAVCGKYNFQVEAYTSWTTLPELSATTAIHGLIHNADNIDHVTEVLREVAEPLTRYIRVRILPKDQSALHPDIYSSVQIPFEPFSRWQDELLALFWVLNNRKNLVFINFPGEPTLLGQAYLAGLINHTSKRETPDNEYKDGDGTIHRHASPPKTENYTIHSEILLGFDLAGLEAPFNYERWRTPDGIQCPLRATVRGFDHYGDCVIHWHDGERALVSTAGFKQAHVVKVKSLVSTAISEIAGFVAKAKSPKQPELTDAQIKELANKYV